MNKENLTLFGMDKTIVTACFASVLSEVGETNQKIRASGGHRGVVDELKARGLYTPEFISEEFIRVENGESREPRRVREFIHDVGWAAEMLILEEVQKKPKKK